MKDSLTVKGTFKFQHIRNGVVIEEWEQPNTVVTTGKNYLLEAGFRGTTQISDWYMGLIDGSGSPSIVAGDTHASHAGWTESTAYDEATRVDWSPGAAASGVVTNASALVFTMNATGTCYGVFCSSISTKGSTSAGTLFGAAAFSGGSRAFVDNDQLAVTYTVTLS